MHKTHVMADVRQCNEIENKERPFTYWSNGTMVCVHVRVHVCHSGHVCTSSKGWLYKLKTRSFSFSTEGEFFSRPKKRFQCTL